MNRLPSVIAVKETHADNDDFADAIGEVLGRVVKSMRGALDGIRSEQKEHSLTTAKRIQDAKQSVLGSVEDGFKRLADTMAVFGAELDAKAKRLAELEARLERYAHKDEVKDAGNRFQDGLAVWSKSLNERIESNADNLQAELDRRMETLRGELRDELDPARWIGQMKEVVKAMPAPEVTVENDVIVQPPRLVEKDITYNLHNMPVRIVEKEVKGDDK